MRIWQVNCILNIKREEKWVKSVQGKGFLLIKDNLPSHIID